MIKHYWNNYICIYSIVDVKTHAQKQLKTTTTTRYKTEPSQQTKHESNLTNQLLQTFTLLVFTPNVLLCVFDLWVIYLLRNEMTRKNTTIYFTCYKCFKVNINKTNCWLLVAISLITSKPYIHIVHTLFNVENTLSSYSPVSRCSTI